MINRRNELQTEALTLAEASQRPKLLFYYNTHMKPESGLTILLVSVKYRISETYPVWPLWWSGWAKQLARFPPPFPSHGPSPHSQCTLVMTGYCSRFFWNHYGTMYGLYLLHEMCLKYKQRHTHTHAWEKSDFMVSAWSFFDSSCEVFVKQLYKFGLSRSKKKMLFVCLYCPRTKVHNKWLSPRH